MRKSFDEQLALLNRELITMGAMCESAIALAAKALIEGDSELAGRVSDIEEAIDQKERDIETLCLKLLLQQQPVARDLRLISAAMKMITDMERIGDQARDIAEIVTLANITASGDKLHIAEMARAAIKMVTESIDAFVAQDIKLAESVIAYDDVVDRGFDSVKTALIEMFGQPETDAEFALDLLMVAKYLERIGDHATNIAEWVVYSISGIHKGEALP
ncbi:MAG: phosphate signaling complex protein PhoU [Clostridia bacterium]|nr:phosphate signaling complex protein PhoU [Clostridia bacterium]